MCLVAVSLRPGHRFPIVIAANRDEYFARPTAPLAWWPDAPILAGRDLQAGGTWLGLSLAGRFGFVTNVRGMMAHDPAAPSRGEIVPEWLTREEAVEPFLARTLQAGHNGFNAIVGDLASAEFTWASNCAPAPVRLASGTHVVSNHLLDTPWPKALALKSRLAEAVDTIDDIDAMCDRLLAALADPTEAPADALPSTGIPPERERRLSPAFIRMPEIGYGTRCSTLVVVEQVGDAQLTHVLERSFDAAGAAVTLRQRVGDRRTPV